MKLSKEMARINEGGIQPTPKRVKMIFSVMSNPKRIDILRILNARGSATYSELKDIAGFTSKKDSGRFAYHLRKLLGQSLTSLNKSERRYSITNLGKLVLSLARQIEERSIIESGKLYVRSSSDSIDEFNSHKIIQSLVREGNLPLELAQKITEEAESKIYKYQTAYLTGSIIREIVNSVLLEYGHEEYRNRLARLGVPVFDLEEMISNVDSIDNGVEGLLFKTGQRVLNEHLLINKLPKDIADYHLSGALHITNPGVWSLLPDTIFISAKDLLEDGLDLGGKYLDVSRITSSTLDDLVSALSVAISLVSREASQEVVIDGLSAILSRHANNASELEGKLTGAFVTASAASRYGRPPTTVSIRLRPDDDTAGPILNAYRNYTQMTPIPRIGLVIDYDQTGILSISQRLAEIISLGGLVAFGRGHLSSRGVTNSSMAASPVSIKLQSVSVNLPRLALESNKDETYFRARLALLLSPTLNAMALRKKDISDLTRRGLNPVLAKNSQYMQRSSISMMINLVGLREAIFNILGYKNDKTGRGILLRAIETAVDVAAKKGKELGDEIRVCMIDGGGAARFAALDDEKYGKNSVLGGTDSDSYTQGVDLLATKIDNLTTKSDEIVECNRLTKILNGGLAVRLIIARDASVDDIRLAIQRTASLVQSFVPVKAVPICGGCGFKDADLSDRCPRCKSPYIL